MLDHDAVAAAVTPVTGQMEIDSDRADTSLEH
jgi:hypothetical protein